MRTGRAVASLGLLLLAAGCHSALVQDQTAAAGRQASILKDQALGDPQNLRDYALGQTEQSVTQHLHARPTSRKPDAYGNDEVTWTLRDGRLVIGEFDNQGRLTEVHFAAPAKP